MKAESHKSMKKRTSENELPETFLEHDLVIDRQDALKSEYDILVEEYKAMKSEISELLREARQITNLALTAIGVFIAGIAAVVQWQIRLTPELLLVLPFLFYFLTCIQLRYVFQALDIGKYLSGTTIPHVQNLLCNLLPDRKQEIETVLSWEMPKRGPIPTRGVLFFPIASASYGMPFLFSIILIGIYKFLNPGLQLNLSPDNILLGLNAVAILYCASWALKAERER